MSGIRSLDWSPLDLDKDPVRTDLDAVHEAQKRFKNIADTIHDAVAKLDKIISSNSEGLAGGYVEGLKSDAESIKADLKKAGARYDDVVREAGIYEPHLVQGLGDTKKALEKAEEAQGDQAKATGMPDPQKDSDGKISDKEKEKGDDKDKAAKNADNKLADAKKDLQNALDALNDAGKRFGDAVNCDRYDDGLTDSGWDRFVDWLARVGGDLFGWLAAAFAILALLIPGVNLIVLGAFVTAGLSLVVSSILYHEGKGSLLDVILGALGLGAAGLGAIVSLWGKIEAAAARAFARMFGTGGRGWGIGGDAIPLVPTGPITAEGAAAALEWLNMAEWFNNPLFNWLLRGLGIITPEVGFLKSFWAQLKGAWELWKSMFKLSGPSFKQFLAYLAGIQDARELAAVFKATGIVVPRWVYLWGVAGAGFNMFSLIYSILRLQKLFPDVNPPGAPA
ncbi:hypothetical protein [Streptomyces benahoarensis]|uniref:Uncharacterized protein n=1 Tax=Streptomyces benahoarensis TaxID=2595054 RepID=A0A553ZQW7_9ACTN|nr:hypothetical protein [Streptomyces benahoarensis]TSB32821.1 hypothetical protein FNJ62_00670 [Streptomyces benahoarensis]TSB43852.1 hypothetical protein FNZ23_02015 [Streptomyces benahoarensis]